MKEDGTISKRGWMMAHFSKFVRRGFYRVEVPKSPTNDVYMSAYKSDSDVVVVVVNENSSSQSVTLSVAGRDVDSFERYVTTGSKNMNSESAATGSDNSFTVSLEGQSVTTLHAAR